MFFTLDAVMRGKTVSDPNRNSGSYEYAVVLDAGNHGGVPSLQDYLLHSKQELNAIAKSFAEKAAITLESRDWMLAQADFIVETVGDEAIETSDQMRSDLLQLLLAIADLNEQVRRRGASGIPSTSRA
jgi:hypothetical protein